jgi:hypothetical protein
MPLALAAWLIVMRCPWYSIHTLDRLLAACSSDVAHLTLPGS